LIAFHIVRRGSVRGTKTEHPPAIADSGNLRLGDGLGFLFLAADS
jgi:hypothetical protein